jgi:hypothetical protein
VYSSIISDFEARVMLEREKPEWVAQRILRSFPVERAFTFSYEFARPTQFAADSLEEFASALRVVDLKSVEFHNERGDFERWIRQVVGDDILANRLKKIADEKLHGEALREKTINTIEQRMRELKTMTKTDR